jgi:hypothetical protein
VNEPSPPRSRIAWDGAAGHLGRRSRSRRSSNTRTNRPRGVSRSRPSGRWKLATPHSRSRHTPRTPCPACGGARRGRMVPPVRFGCASCSLDPAHVNQILERPIGRALTVRRPAALPRAAGPGGRPPRVGLGIDASRFTRYWPLQRHAALFEPNWGVWPVLARESPNHCSWEPRGSIAERLPIL